MDKNFESISEAKLWDNLKFKADITLKKIQNIEDVHERIKIFTLPRYLLIQELLKDIGKDFFKLFLHKAIQNGFKDNKNIDDLINNFQFFFWPGFTTLKGNRIFIEGAVKPESKHRKKETSRKKEAIKEQRYFTGVGNNKIKAATLDNVIRYLKKPTNNPNLFSRADKNWIYNIPSTLAFDSVLNQFYFDQNSKDFEKPYQAGSTHHWKISQRRPSEGNKTNYIPMPLSSDSSELRILEVISDDKASRPNVSAANSVLSVRIPGSLLCRIGNIIEFELDSKRVPIIISDADKDHFINWPKVKPIFDTMKYGLSDKDVYYLQTKSYSFWLSETLNSKLEPVQDYSYIRKAFDENGYHTISDKIRPFKEMIKAHLSEIDEFEEMYYNNWYTLFLDSYDESVDLGTAMFLTNDIYDNDFLTKCASWLRWIFFELRLLEATAWDEIKGMAEQQEEDFGKLSHNTKLLFPYLQQRINDLNNNNFEILKETLVSEISNLEHVIRASFHSNNLKQFKNLYPPEKVDLLDLIQQTVKQIEFDLRYNYGKIIKLWYEPLFIESLLKALDSAEAPLYKFHVQTPLPVNIIGNKGIIQIILKDIIGNATKYSTSLLDPGSPPPMVEITIKEDPVKSGLLIFECSNSEFITRDAIYIWKHGVIPQESKLTGCFGLKIASVYCRAFDISKSVYYSKTTNKTIFTLNFKKWTNSE